jgi:hypothetical protein
MTSTGYWQTTFWSRRPIFRLKLRCLEDYMADILMEHLPPSGWGDVARKSDIEYLATLMDTQFGAVDSRFEYLEASIRGLQHAMWALASLMSACFIATFTILATQL